MLPKTFIACEVFPLNAAGKTDKKQLIDVTDNTIEATKKLIPLEAEIERRIANVWGTLLSIDEGLIDKSRNFFNLGGDSLLAAAAVSLLDGVCTLNDFYTYQNLEQLACRNHSTLPDPMSKPLAQETESIQA